MIIINESQRDIKQEKRDCETCTSNHIIYVHFYELIHLASFLASFSLAHFSPLSGKQSEAANL